MPDPDILQKLQTLLLSSFSSFQIYLSSYKAGPTHCWIPLIWKTPISHPLLASSALSRYRNSKFYKRESVDNSHCNWQNQQWCSRWCHSKDCRSMVNQEANPSLPGNLLFLPSQLCSHLRIRKINVVACMLTISPLELSTEVAGSPKNEELWHGKDPRIERPTPIVINIDKRQKTPDVTRRHQDIFFPLISCVLRYVIWLDVCYDMWYDMKNQPHSVVSVSPARAASLDQVMPSLCS